MRRCQRNTPLEYIFLSISCSCYRLQLKLGLSTAYDGDRSRPNDIVNFCNNIFLSAMRMPCQERLARKNTPVL